MKTILLASTSSARKALLRSAGILFRAVAPNIEETAPLGFNPQQIARHLALQKAQAVASLHPSSLVIGSDQTVDLDGELLRKPRSRAEARKQISSMAGRDHWLHTALAVVRQKPHFKRIAVESVRLTMRQLSKQEIEAYLDTNEWQGCAGGYRVEGQGIKLLQALKGDFHAVVGLPLLRLVKFLKEAEVALF